MSKINEKLTLTNFFSEYIHNARDKRLSENDQKKAFWGKIACYILSLGVIPAICWIVRKCSHKNRENFTEAEKNVHRQGVSILNTGNNIEKKPLIQNHLPNENQDQGIQSPAPTMKDENNKDASEFLVQHDESKKDTKEIHEEQKEQIEENQEAKGIGENYESRLPKEVKSYLLSFLSPKELQKVGLISKEYLELSDKTIIKWLNKNKGQWNSWWFSEADRSYSKPFKLNFEQKLSFLKRAGGKLEFLEIEDVKELEFLQYCPNLRSLIVRNGCKLESENLNNFIKNLDTQHLETLVLAGTYIGDKGIESLCRLNFPKLEELCLVKNNLGPDGIKHLSDFQNFPSLKILNLNWNPLMDEGLRYIADSQNFHLEKLVLFEVSASEVGIKYLVDSPNITSLTHLRFGSKTIKKMFSSLSSSQKPLPLQTLQLLIKSLELEDFDNFANSPNFSKLRELDIVYVIGPEELVRDDKTIKPFFDSKKFPNLQSIDIVHTGPILDENFYDYSLPASVISKHFSYSFSAGVKQKHFSKNEKIKIRFSENESGAAEIHVNINHD